MVQSNSNIPAADYLVNKDPWLRRLGGRQAGKLISEALFESTPPILRGRPIYDRLPGGAEAYNKETNNFLSRGTIVLPEARTVISTAEDVYFRDKFPQLYQERDYVTGSYYGAGSGAALFNDSLRPVGTSVNITDREIFFRSAVLFWPRTAIRDSTDIAKQSITFEGTVVKLPLNGSGWFWLDGNGNLNVTEGLPDGIANLTGNIWCNPDALSSEKSCVQRVFSFQRDDNFADVIDVGLTDDEITWPVTPESEARYASEVAPLYKYTVVDGQLTEWQDFRSFNRSFDPPVARWLTEYWDNLLQDKREQIDTFVDDSLSPDTVGLQFIPTTGSLRNNYKPRTVDKILEAWDFGLITEQELTEGMFSFISVLEYQELREYDERTNLQLDWLAQHFGFQDNGSINENYWHNGSFYFNSLATNEVYYTIAEKRAILRNALSQDTFQNYQDFGNFERISPIWNTFGDFYDTTNLIWNRRLDTGVADFEFVFTRFPFTIYNRIKPSEWFGLQRAKGTIKALEFMFDVLGLHGYACTKNEPRLYDEPVDFETPLLIFKFTNSVTVERRRIVDESGAIVDANEPPLFNTQGYEQTGVFQIGETVFQEGYDRKVLVRAPFWNRNSQKWNRLQEIAATYARPGELVTGYYQFLSGLSAVSEPLWLPEVCTTCTYNVSTKLMEEAEQVNNGDIEGLAIQNNSDEFTWNKIGPDKIDENLELANIEDLVYIDSRIIIGGLNKSIVSTDGNLNHGIVPIVISTDNGKVYEVSDTPSPVEIDYIKRVRVFGNNIYAIGFNDVTDVHYLLRSLDATASWDVIATSSDTLFQDVPFLDIFHDLDARKLYLLTEERLYTRFDNNKLWSSILVHDKGALSAANLGNQGSASPQFTKGLLARVDSALFVYLLDTIQNIILIQRVINEGQAKFVDYVEPLPNIDLDGVAVEPILRIATNNNADIDEPYIVYLYDPGNLRNQSKIYYNTFEQNYVEVSNLSEKIKSAVSNSNLDLFPPGFTLEGGSPINIEYYSSVTDIVFDYSESRWLLLISLRTNLEKSRGLIISSDILFEEFKIEQDYIELLSNFDVSYGSMTNSLINKIQTTQDIDAAPVDEPITTLIDDDFVDIFVPVYDENSNFAPPPNTDRSITIKPDTYLQEFRYFSWKIPRLRRSFDFNVTQGFIYDELQVSTSIKDKLTISGTAYTETDKISLFFRLQTIDGYFITASDNQQQGYQAFWTWAQFIDNQQQFDNVVIDVSSTLDFPNFTINSSNTSFSIFDQFAFFNAPYSVFINADYQLAGKTVYRALFTVLFPEVQGQGGGPGFPFFPGPF